MYVYSYTTILLLGLDTRRQLHEVEGSAEDVAERLAN